MANFFGKPIAQIDADDILSLIDTPEGQLFEIKSKLAADKNSSDSWYIEPLSGKPRKGPGDYAKENVFREVVAFANSEGGWLVLGLTETSDHPKRVKEIAPLPACHELAERFKRAAYDWIDPPLPSLQCRGIEMGDTSGEGVIVFRVPRSLEAPHRLYKKDRVLEAYKRVTDESKPMRMREIQDLTLNIARGQERIDKEFNDARERYLLLRPQQSPKKRLIGFNITLVSLSGPLIVDRPYIQSDLFERKPNIKGRFLNSHREQQFQAFYPGIQRGPTDPQPTLRGGRKTWLRLPIPIRQDNDESVMTVEIFESGTVQLSFRNTKEPPELSIGFVLADVANALCIVERARAIGGMPDAEYVMEIELRYDEILEGNKSKLCYQDFEFVITMEDGFQYPRKLGPGPLLLPRYRVGSINDFSIILKVVMDDLYNAVGEPHIDDFSFDRICG